MVSDKTGSIILIFTFSIPIVVVISYYLWWQKHIGNSPGYIPLESRLPPSDIVTTVEEFADFRHKLKRRTSILFIFFMLIFGPMLEVGMWYAGPYPGYQKEKIENLQTMQGVFFFYYKRGRGPIRETGLKDGITGVTILNASVSLCGDSKVLEKYNGQSATVWYNRLPANGRYPMIYQLKIGNEVVCDLESANKRVDDLNKEQYEYSTSLLILRMGWLINCFVIIGALCYKDIYRKNILDLYGEVE